jgi:hypothetical protein
LVQNSAPPSVYLQKKDKERGQSEDASHAALCLALDWNVGWHCARLQTAFCQQFSRLLVVRIYNKTKWGDGGMSALRLPDFLT